MVCLCCWGWRQEGEVGFLGFAGMVFAGSGSVGVVLGWSLVFETGGAEVGDELGESL